MIDMHLIFVITTKRQSMHFMSRFRKGYNLARRTSVIEDAIFEINKLDLLQNLKYSDVLKLLDINIIN